MLPIARRFLYGERLKNLDSLPSNIVVHNLQKGIPYEANSVDAVYHSHLLEHLDREVALVFMAEVLRVLKPGGIHRIVVPDFEVRATEYLMHVSACETNPDESAHHDSFIAPLIEQSVRREATGTSQQKPIRRFIENAFLGDARKKGETHQWMYDRFSLKAKLIDVGYGNVVIQDYKTSLIDNWNEYALDLNTKGGQYKPDSLYVEAIK